MDYVSSPVDYILKPPSQKFITFIQLKKNK